MEADPVVPDDEETEEEADELRQECVDLVVELGGDLVLGELGDADVDCEQGDSEREDGVTKEQ